MLTAGYGNMSNFVFAVADWAVSCQQAGLNAALAVATLMETCADTGAQHWSSCAALARA